MARTYVDGWSQTEPAFKMALTCVDGSSQTDAELIMVPKDPTTTKRRRKFLAQQVERYNTALENAKLGKA
ncbi:hypothetical protein KIN20_035828 [Parelaphostrongylus tenuis]|uniref:Uncharacterized protein n=1 Tax=Parelaphostrongylus tenuis TaxID=148309 RepID=A0AAD5RC11_PARTN|nr:hypothetical protein KIN20_035828 [Parelaphostrongylus tenuis]